MDLKIEKVGLLEMKDVGLIQSGVIGMDLIQKEVTDMGLIPTVMIDIGLILRQRRNMMLT